MLVMLVKSCIARVFPPVELIITGNILYPSITEINAVIIAMARYGYVTMDDVTDDFVSLLLNVSADSDISVNAAFHFKCSMA